MSGEADTHKCKFPGWTKAAGVTVIDRGEEDIALCEEHRDLLIENPTEFRRLWGAFHPRQPDAAPVFHPRPLDHPS